MLRLVKPDHDDEADGTGLDSNRLLRRALERITLGSPACQGYPIICRFEAEALYRALSHRAFTPEQLEEWVRRVLSDSPYDRRRSLSGRSQRGLLHRLFGRWRDAEESIDEWRKRAERFVQERIASVADPRWIEGPLARLEQARAAIEYETGERQWTTVVMHWALVHLLTISADDAGAWAPRATTG